MPGHGWCRLRVSIPACAQEAGTTARPQTRAGTLLDVPTDEEAIRNLIGLHSQLTDDGEYQRRVQLYTEDGVFMMGDAASRGRDEMAEAFASTSAPERRGKHITANTVMEIDGDAASARTDFFFLLPSAEGLKPLAAGRYFDTFTKKDGHWLYSERRITFLGT
jgi:ketosteroid isomerase-like protein